MPALPQYFVVVFVPNPQTGWTTRDAMGFAPIRIGEQRRAYVFVNRVKELLDLVAPGQLRLSIFGSALALALTHETGHLLMPGETIHAKNGIMSTKWSYKQWIEARQGSLLFLPEEMRAMHRALEASQPRVQAANGRKSQSQ
jgi:asparagine synthetase B (glutamine-hydrolysing)